MRFAINSWFSLIKSIYKVTQVLLFNTTSKFGCVCLFINKGSVFAMELLVSLVTHSCIGGDGAEVSKTYFLFFRSVVLKFSPTH